MEILRILNDWLHLTMAVIWIGGIHYHFVILGTTARELPAEAQGALTMGTFKRFTRIVWASVLVLLVTGVSKGIYLKAFGGLFVTTYGWILGIKLLLVVAMIVVAGLFSFVFGPQLKSLLNQSSETPNPELTALQKKMSMLVRTNLLLGMLILLAVVMLAATT
ncbi:MAG: DUF4149 domain-containing protein [bacterium]